MLLYLLNNICLGNHRIRLAHYQDQECAFCDTKPSIKGQVSLEFMVVFLVYLLTIVSFIFFVYSARDINQRRAEFVGMNSIVESLYDGIIDALVHDKISILSLPEQDCSISILERTLMCASANGAEYSVSLPTDKIFMDDIRPGDTVLIIKEEGRILIVKREPE